MTLRWAGGGRRRTASGTRRRPTPTTGRPTMPRRRVAPLRPGGGRRRTATGTRRSPTPTARPRRPSRHSPQPHPSPRSCPSPRSRRSRSSLQPPLQLRPPLRRHPTWASSRQRLGPRWPHRPPCRIEATRTHVEGCSTSAQRMQRLLDRRAPAARPGGPGPHRHPPLRRRQSQLDPRRRRPVVPARRRRPPPHPPRSRSTTEMEVISRRVIVASCSWSWAASSQRCS